MLGNAPNNAGLKISEGIAIHRYNTVVTPAKTFFSKAFLAKWKNEPFLVSDVHVWLLYLQNVY